MYTGLVLSEWIKPETMMPPDGWVGQIRLDDGEMSLGFCVEGKIYTLDTRTLSRCYESPHVHSYLRIFDTPIESAVTKEGITFRCEGFYLEDDNGQA